MKAIGRWQLAWLAQAAMIVLPVVVLSGVALHFLREDRTAIEQDAKNRATSLAPEAARQIGDQLGAILTNSRKNGLLTEGQIVDGRGYADPDYPRLPLPSNWVAQLPPQEKQLWNNAGKSDLTALTEAGRPPAVRANAQLRLLIAAEAQEDTTALTRQAVAIAQQYPGEVTESGTSVSDLALLIALRHAAKGNLSSDLTAALEENLAQHPSFLSTTLLDVAGVPRLRAQWLKQEAVRANTRSLMQSVFVRLALPGTRPVPTLVRLRGNLALCAPEPRGWRVTLVPETTLDAVRANLPGYLGTSIRLKDERAKVTPLASAKGSFRLGTTYPFLLTLDLQNPDLLYAPYRRNLLLTQGLIFFAVAAALFGLWRLWHTYRDQTRLNEMKSNLVSSVSHELRAPIAAVRLMAESLESGRVDGAEKQKDYYRLIVRECGRLSSLVENVLDFSRIDQGRKQYRFQPLDAPAMLRHTVMLMEPGAAERQVRLRLIDPPPELEHLHPSWDREAVEQSMVNLLDNAIKHSPAHAEVLVEVELLPAVVRIWIADKGLGIPVEEQQKIFALFYRCGSEMRRETEGVGIGLSIVKHVAEGHGGRVLVDSKVGQGSRFGLELPR